MLLLIMVVIKWCHEMLCLLLIVHCDLKNPLKLDSCVTLPSIDQSMSLRNDFNFKLSLMYFKQDLKYTVFAE